MLLFGIFPTNGVKIPLGGDDLNNRRWLKLALAGAAAGAVNGLFGAGGGMVLVPLLTILNCFSDRHIFPASISILLPVCIVSITVGSLHRQLPLVEALPYLIGGFTGGLIAGKIEKKLPTVWLHRLLGILILWGGLRYLW